MNLFKRFFGSPSQSRPPGDAKPYSQTNQSGLVPDMFPSTESGGTSCEEIADFNFTEKYLRFHAVDLFEYDLAECERVRQTSDMVAEAYQLFHGRITDIVSLIPDAQRRKTIETRCYARPGERTCLFVTTLPCRAENADKVIAAKSTGSEKGYPDLLRVVLKQRPDASLAHWVHVLISLGEAHLHIGAGKFGSGSSTSEAYLYPAKLLSPEEKLQLGR